MAIADGAFYRPTSIEHDHPDHYDLDFQTHWIPVGGHERLHAWFFPADDPVGTVVHCHGNAGNISAHFKFVAWLPACGWNVLCFDYRGYGRSSGKVTRAGTIEDTHAAIAFARALPSVDPKRLCVVGQSLGGSVAIAALTQADHGVCGLCIDGAFSSYRIEAEFVARQSWLLRGGARLLCRMLISDEYSPINCADRLGALPKLFICGDEDRTVDYRQTVALYERASDPKELWVIKGSGHTEALTGEIPGGRERVVSFLHGCVADRA